MRYFSESIYYMYSKLMRKPHFGLLLGLVKVMVAITKNRKFVSGMR
jgi:hypothetical protein